jgi:hypothetical protein
LSIKNNEKINYREVEYGKQSSDIEECFMLLQHDLNCSKNDKNYYEIFLRQIQIKTEMNKILTEFNIDNFILTFEQNENKRDQYFIPSYFYIKGKIFGLPNIIQHIDPKLRQIFIRYISLQTLLKFKNQFHKEQNKKLAIYYDNEFLSSKFFDKEKFINKVLKLNFDPHNLLIILKQQNKRNIYLTNNIKKLKSSGIKFIK